MYRIQINVLTDIIYKHIQYNYIGITTFRDLFFFNNFFLKTSVAPIMNQNVYGLIQ